MTLGAPDGQGVAELLRGPLLAGRARVHPRRWQITLGLDQAGRAVTLPASQINVAVCGASGTGKSYMAGLICEQLIGLCYPWLSSTLNATTSGRVSYGGPRHRRRQPPSRRSRSGHGPPAPPLLHGGRRPVSTRRRRSAAYA